MQWSMNPILPHLLVPNATVDLIGLIIASVPVFMGLLAFSDRARKFTQAILSIYNVYQSFRDKMAAKKPAPSPTNGNGNGNGNGVTSDLLKSVMQTIRSESDARESGDDVVKAEVREMRERARRDIDNLYIAVSDISRDNENHAQDITLLKVETGALRSQMALMFKNEADMNDKLDTILHLLQPPTPPGDVIALDDADELGAVG